MKNDKKAADVFQSESEHDKADHHTPGTMVLVLVLLGTFVVYYFANWKALADVRGRTRSGGPRPPERPTAARNEGGMRQTDVDPIFRPPFSQCSRIPA